MKRNYGYDLNLVINKLYNKTNESKVQNMMR